MLVLSLMMSTNSDAVEKHAPPPRSSDQAHGSRLHITNAALLITMDPSVGEGQLGTLRQADVLINKDTIEAVGPNLSAPDAVRMDATGKILMPGFVDVHNHLIQSVLRGACSGEDLLGWLDKCARPAYRHLRLSDVYPAVRLSTLDLIRTGVTTVVDWAGGLEPDLDREYLRALTESGLRFVYAPMPTDGDSRHIIRLKEELIDPDPLATLQLSSRSEMAWNDHLTKTVVLARELGVKVNVHLLEQRRQRDNTPVESLRKSGALALGPDLLVDHAIHLTDDEIALLASHDVRVSHNPLSNMRLASGIIRLPELHAAGLRIGLGLDGGTNDTSDMFNAMRTAVGLQRVRTEDAAVFPSVNEVLGMATLGGAAVLDMSDLLGSLTPGKKADLLIVNPTHVNFAPRFDWISQLVFNGQPVNVETVFVNGKPLLLNGWFTGDSQEGIIKAAEETARRLRMEMGLGE